MKHIVQKVIWSTIEDFVGLWEIEWEVNSLLPDGPVTLTRNITMKILLSFVENDLVDFYYSRWGDNLLEVIDKSQAIEIINGGKYWEAPNFGELCVKVGSTKKGEKFYNEGIIKDFVK